MNIAQLMVAISADITDLQDKLKQAEAGLSSFGRDVETVNAGLLTSAGIAVTAGTAIALGLKVAAGAAGAAQKEVMLLEQALRASGLEADTGPYKRLASSLQTLTGVSDETIVAAMRLLVNFGATRDMVEQLTPRILNFAAATGRDVVEAAQLFGRAITRGAEGGMMLRRVLGENIDLVQNFGGAMDILDVKFGGAAETLGRTMPQSFQRLRQSVSDFLEVIGGPLLDPLASVAKAGAALAQALTRLATACPLPTKAVVTFLGIMSALLIGAGGLIAARIAVGRLIPLFIEKAAAVNVASASLNVLAVSTTRATFALRALISATLVGAIITLASVVLPLLIENWDKVVAKFVQGGTFLVTLWKNIGQGIFDVIQGIQRFDLSRVRNGIDELKNAYKDASEKGVQAYNARIVEETENTKRGLDTRALAIKSLKALRDEYEAAGKAAKLAALQQEEAAAAVARASLQRTGLTTEAIEAIEERRLKTIRASSIAELRQRVAQGERVLALAKSLGQEESDETKKVAEEVATARRDIQARILEDASATAKATVEQEKALAEERLRIATDAARRRAETIKEGLDLELSIAKAKQAAADEDSARRLDALRLEEDVRLAMLRRVAGAEIELGKSVLTAREGLLKAIQTRQETAELEAEADRKLLVERGFLTEEEAMKRAQESRAAITRQRIQQELSLEQGRLLQIERAAQVEVQVAQAEAASKLAILDAESKARVAQFQTNAAMRQAELVGEVTAARAETAAKIAELQAQFAARRAMLIRELKEREAAGLISPEESAARRARIAEADEEFQTVTKAFADSLAARQDAARVQIELLAKNTAAAIEAEDRTSALRREQIAVELATRVDAANQKMIADRTSALERLTSLERAASEEVIRIRNDAAKAGLLTDAQIAAAQSRVKMMQSQVGSMFDEQRSIIERAVAGMTSAYEDMGHRVKAALQPAVDALRLIAQPTVPAFTSVVAGAGIPQASTQVTNNFTFAGTTFRLTADEASILSRIIETLMGPTGADIVNRHLRRRPRE